MRDGLVVQEWTATATHANEMRRGDLVAEPTGKKITWDGLDVIPFEDGLVKRKDVYSDSVSILHQLGLHRLGRRAGSTAACRARLRDVRARGRTGALSTLGPAAPRARGAPR